MKQKESIIVALYIQYSKLLKKGKEKRVRKKETKFCFHEMIVALNKSGYFVILCS